MLVKHAKAVARQWVIEKASNVPGFHGAYFAGSTNWLPDDARFPATSDLDVNLVLEAPGTEMKLGKFVYRGALLEVSYIPHDALRSPEAVLGNYHLAGGFRTRSIILDPTGALTALQEAVAREYAQRSWVRKRCEHAASRALNLAQSLDGAGPFHDQVTSCVFAAGVTTHVLLVAGLKNPTVRRRYAATRELLAEYGRLDFQKPLLALLGCAEINRERVEHHLGTVAAAFDAAKIAIKTPYRFGSDISDVARPIAIDGSRELIERSLHREAVFWIAATYSRCRTIFAADAPELISRFDGGYRELLADLGIDSFQDRRLRCREVEEFLPGLWEVVEEILAANPGIEE
ncbi:MAG: hypothetical protein M1118_01930 [Chloroflexi bacterium]|nr:hypothetical protein [Chloroflexota bacterium]